MVLSKILNESKATGDCHAQCVDIAGRISGGADIKKIFHKNNPWGENTMPMLHTAAVKHLTGDYTCHFVVQVGGVVLDPFLRDDGPIPADEYLARAYKNAEELRLV